MKCRFCGTTTNFEFIDLHNAPPSNSYLSEEQLNEPEVFYPLKVKVCSKCFLVQIDEYKKHDEIFNSEYAYFSSFSSSWITHSKNYVDMITQKIALDSNSFVIEIASNDGYLLQFFKDKNIPCLGIEPTKSTADVARAKGIEVVEDFFGKRLAMDLPKADLILGNNVLAHVPNINDFVIGLKTALKPTGTITMEFPHLFNLMKQNQFDTIYHEHFSYLSLGVVEKIFNSHGLDIYDAQELQTHGGSLRIYATHTQATTSKSENFTKVLQKEYDSGMDSLEGYKNFQHKAEVIKYDFLDFLLKAKMQGKKVAAYGAAAKGNTLLNFCGIKSDFIDFVVDKAPSKIGKYLPGSHIPIVQEQLIKETKPDFVVIFAWNIKDEIVEQLSYIREWNAKFVTAIPKLEIF